MADTFKTQDYYNIMSEIACELPNSKPGDLRSERSEISPSAMHILLKPNGVQPAIALRLNFSESRT